MEYEVGEKGYPRGISFTPCPDRRYSCVSCVDSLQPPAAVVIRNARKSFGKGKEIIKDLNMTIRQGTIYSLLGCSGCGKSTTLSCIVGLDKFTSGDVWLFGKAPGAKEVGIPGRNVGFMPQDYSLYTEFTIMEIITYFGILNGMDPYEIMCSIVFYTNLLNLPKFSSRIGSLSGGQKRRVSFAISLQHDPELVLLDEPTVGVDALLRESIWKYLVNLAKEKNTTVIITTHYIEEARHSDTVGVMSNGKLLAEENPRVLLERFATNSLEFVVLQLTRNENVLEQYKNNNDGAVCSNGEFNHFNSLDASLDPIIKSMQINSSLPQMALAKSQVAPTAQSITRIKALVNKNIRNAVRNLTMLIMIIIIPTIGIACNFIGNGHMLKNINIGVVNKELQKNNYSSCYDPGLPQLWVDQCDTSYFSCRYLTELQSPTINIISFKDEEEAVGAVRNGEILGFLQFPEEYSWFLYERTASGINATNPMIFNQSTLVARFDESNAISIRLIETELYIAYKSFLKTLFSVCNYDLKKLNFGLTYHEPILGAEVKSFNDFVMTSLFVGFMFFWPIVTTGVRYVQEKQDGTIARSLVAGVSIWEIYVAYTVTEFLIAVARMIIIYLMTIYVFKLSTIGSLFLQFCMGILSSFMGVSAGFLFGALCTEEIQVALLSIAIFLPNVIMSGMVWPVEGMPVIMQHISYVLPCTLASEAMRSITSRGWGLMHPNVWPGFVSTFGYMMLYLILAILLSNKKFTK